MSALIFQVATQLHLMFQIRVTVCLFVFCVVQCFVDLNMYFAGVILQSIGMYVQHLTYMLCYMIACV